MPDLYETLGVARDASMDEIKRAGRRRQKQTHPDAGGDREEFEAVQKAMTVLLDPGRRENYDRTGDEKIEMNPEELERQEAISLLAQMMMQVLQKGDPDATHVVNQTKAMLTQNQRGFESALRDLPRQRDQTIAGLTKVINRLKRTKTEGEDFMRGILEGQITAAQVHCTQQTAHAERALRITRMALEMAEGYTYEVKPPAHTVPGWTVLGQRTFY